MLKFVGYSVFTFILFFQHGCGDQSSYTDEPLKSISERKDDTSSTSTTSTVSVADQTQQSKSFNGILVDGYIKDATVCLDLNKNNECEEAEPKTTTNEDGEFSFSNILVDENSTLNFLAYGGVDTSTQKPFHETFNLNTTYDTLSESSLVISPITDLVSHYFLNQYDQSYLDLADAESKVSDMLQISETQLYTDPMKSIEIFTKSQEIQHTKLLIETIAKKYYSLNPSYDELELIDMIKKELLLQEFDIQRTLIALEIKLSIEFDQNVEEFVVAQKTELERCLNNLSSDTSLSISNLNRLQKAIDLAQQQAYDAILNADENSTLEVFELGVTSDTITQTNFDSSYALLDEQACNTSDGYMKMGNDSSINAASVDELNGVRINSNYTLSEDLDMSQVNIFYKPLEGSITNSVAVIFGDKYYFVYDEAWTQNTSRTIYVQTPKNEDGLHSCYRYELSSINTSEIKATKVFRYSEL